MITNVDLMEEASIMLIVSWILSKYHQNYLTTHDTHITKCMTANMKNKHDKFKLQYVQSFNNHALQHVQK